METNNCPNCGDSLPAAFNAAKMCTCPSCDTTLVLDGAHLQNAGTSGQMHDFPTLLKLGQSIHIKGHDYQVLGHVRFDYGRGWWDEFWVEGTDHRVWISVDEGDVILQRPIPRNDCPANTKPPKLGDTVTAERRNYRVTEASSAICIAVRGHFSEILKIGSQYDYVNCTGENGNLLSGEFSEGAPDWYLGAWLDPFEFTVGIEK